MRIPRPGMTPTTLAVTWDIPSALLFGRRLVSYIFTANKIGHARQLRGDGFAGFFEDEF